MIGITQYVSADQAAMILRAGGLVGLPTETVYGLGADALDPVAVARIFAAKERPHFDPLIVHLPDPDWLPRVVSEFPEVARRLADRFWPGPLTLVLPKSDAIPDLVTSGLPSVGVRIPQHDLMRQVLRLADRPIAAPSANPFGRLSPTTADHVRMQLGDRIDAIVDGGPCRIGVESTILQIQGDRVTLLRHGGIPQEDIEAVIGPVQLADPSQSETPVAPGMLSSHYSPRTPLRVVERLDDVRGSSRMGLLVLQNEPGTECFGRFEVLAADGNLVEAAAKFFQSLHRLDQAKLEEIIAIRLPDVGIGRAMNDRLQRAAYRDPS